MNDPLLWIVTSVNGVLVLVLTVVGKRVGSYIASSISDISDINKKFNNIYNLINSNNADILNLNERMRNFDQECRKELKHIHNITNECVNYLKSKTKQDKQIIKDLEEQKAKQQSYEDVLEKSLRLHKSHQAKIKNIKSEITQINDNISIVKTKSDKE